MAGLTREFRETVKARVAQDQAFREALFSEAVDLLVSGDVATGKAVLRDYINATIGFEELAEDIGTPSRASCACSATRATQPQATCLRLSASYRRLQACIWQSARAGLNSKL